MNCTMCEHDWTQNTDVSAENPEKVREMTDLMFGEFAKYNVLPLDASVATRLAVSAPEPYGGPQGIHLFGQARYRHPG